MTALLDSETNRKYILLSQMSDQLQMKIMQHRRKSKRYHKRARDLICVLLAMRVKRRRVKGFWMLPRTEQWWLDMLRNLDESENEQEDALRESLWKSNFRVQRTTFRYICEQLHECLQRQETNM